jgi:hypothetical protein
MANDLSKYKLPNINNEALMRALSTGLLNFGNDQGSPGTNQTLPVGNDMAKKEQAGGKSEIVGNTIKDLLPALFGLGAGLVGRKAGLRPNDALGLGVTSMNAAESVKNTYQSNKQRYYNRIASKLVDEYVAKAGGKVDSNMIYKTLKDDHPDVFNNIEIGGFIESKMAERNKVIELSTKEYGTQAQKLAYYKKAKYDLFDSGGQMISDDPDVGPNRNSHYTNKESMLKILHEKFKDKFVNLGGKITFRDQKDYDEFMSYMNGLEVKGNDGVPYKYDMDEVALRVSPPLEYGLGDGSNNLNDELKRARIDEIHARTKKIKEKMVSTSRGGKSGKRWVDIWTKVNQSYVGDPLELTQIADAFWDYDNGKITAKERDALIKDQLKNAKDSQIRDDWFGQWVKEKMGGGTATQKKESELKLPGLD